MRSTRSQDKKRLNAQQISFEEQLFPIVSKETHEHQHQLFHEKQTKAKGIKSKPNHQSSGDVNKSPLNYLYDSKETYPIIEYLPSEEEAETLTPSFVLEVTWPRIIQFYHPYSARCQSFQSTFVSLARGIKRRSSRLPIEFHAVNCGVYRELCELGFNVKAVPTLIGYESGKIEKIAISLPEIDGMVDSAMENLARVMGIPLDVKGQDTITVPAMTQGIHNNISMGEIRYVANMISMNDRHGKDSHKLSRRQSVDVFNDAKSSLFIALTSYLSDRTTHAPDRTSALAEFIDLVRWAFPPETDIHKFAQGIKLDFEKSIASEEELLEMIRRHTNQGIKFVWSTPCTSSANGGYICGLWSLLHILTVGVAERHKFVLGDTESVSVVYSGQVIRNFIYKLFVGCGSCRVLWIKMFDDTCSGMYDTDHIEAGYPDAIKVDDEWRYLALCVWKMHNKVTIHGEQSSKNGYHIQMKKTALLWPTKVECAECWQSLPDDNGLGLIDLMDRNEVYSYLKRVYWPGGIHNNRLIVLNKLSEAKRALNMKRLRARAHDWSTPVLILNMIVACYMIRVFRPRLRSIVIVLLDVFGCGRQVMLRRKRHKYQIDPRLMDETSLRSGEPGRRSHLNRLRACKSSSESRFRQSMRSHNGVSHGYATTSRRTAPELIL